jgi:hypothetical protein
MFWRLDSVSVFRWNLLSLAESIDRKNTAWFIYPILCWYKWSEIGTSSIDWVQLSRFLPEEGDRIQCPKRCVLNKNRTMNYIKKHNNQTQYRHCL